MCRCAGGLIVMAGLMQTAGQDSRQSLLGRLWRRWFSSPAEAVRLRDPSERLQSRAGKWPDATLTPGVSLRLGDPAKADKRHEGATSMGSDAGVGGHADVAKGE